MKRKLTCLAALVALLALGLGCEKTSADTKPEAKAPAADAEKKEAPKADAAKPDAAKGGAPGGAERAPAPVKVAAAESRDMPMQLENIASVEPISVVEVKAQVSGEVVEVLFNEGDAVTAGQELFRLDARPFEAELKQLEAKRARAQSMATAARAQVTRDKAQAENMGTELQRNKTLLDREMVTRAEYDTARAAATASQASVDASNAAVASAGDDIRAAEADLDRAKLNLEYCIIRAPIAGRTGALQIHKGDIVKANDTAPMVTIAQMQPIYVSLTLAERYLGELRQRMREGALPVTARVPTGTAPPVEGTLTFIDNLVDRATSTIRLKASFPNQDEFLWPGQYVQAAVQMSVTQNAVVVPSQAVLRGQKGPYVYVIGADMKAELRIVKPGATLNGVTAIDEGLKPGENVVVDGQMKTAPGATVVLATDAPAAAPAPKQDAKP